MLAAVALVPAGCGGPLDGTALRSDVAADGRSPRVPSADQVRVLVEFQRDSLGERMGAERLAPAEQRAHVRSLRREADATLSALRARGVRLRRVVTFERVWNGFAATVGTDDLPQVGTLGLRAQPVRRFFPATSAPAVLDRGGRPQAERRGPPAVAAIGEPAVLTPLLGDRAVLPLALVRDRRNEQTGAIERAATTDELIGALERAVDPDADGDVEDRVSVALVGLNSPYSSFADSPEARAAAAATAAGTLVVAPAGHDGPRPRGARFGTIGSPGGAALVVAAAPLRGAPDPAPPSLELGIVGEDGRERIRGRLLAGSAGPRTLPLVALTGPSQADPRFRGRAEGDDPLQYFTVDARPRARGRAVVVPAGGSAPEVAAAAAAAGAEVVILCDPTGAAVAPADAPAGISLVALSGEAARRTLELVASPGAQVFLGAPERERQVGARAPARTSSTGPSYGLRRKPDLVAPGAALVTLSDGRRAFVSGSGVAAASVAATAAALRRRLPGAAPRQIAARLVVGARPVRGAGAGVPDLARAQALRRAPAWPAAPVRAARTTAPAVGRPVLLRDGARVSGVRFAAGSVRRQGHAIAVEPVARLVLELAGAEGSVRRELTPPGGALHLLPGEYAYTLTRALLEELPAGRYRFRVRARGPGGRTITERRSETFDLR